MPDVPPLHRRQSVRPLDRLKPESACLKLSNLKCPAKTGHCDERVCFDPN
jgi:hypothetical protein